MDTGDAHYINYRRLYIRLFYLVKGAQHDFINLHYLISNYDPSGIIKNFKVNRTRGHVPRAFYLPLHSPPALPGSAPAVYTMPGPKTPYTPTRDPPRVAAAAIVAGIYAIMRCYASIKPVAPLYGAFILYRYVYPIDIKTQYSASQGALLIVSILLHFCYYFEAISLPSRKFFENLKKFD
jgi:hypothetical protein